MWFRLKGSISRSSTQPQYSVPAWQSRLPLVSPDLPTSRHVAPALAERITICTQPASPHVPDTPKTIFVVAPEPYGGPDGLRRLVDACHAHGLAAFLDVVYNHLGPEGNHAGEFGPYYSD